jgi:peptidoglycan/LPS O-acetylase OafA/YrhL
VFPKSRERHYEQRMQSQPASGAYPRNLNPQIHGLRGFSALAVFIYHVYGMGTLWDFWPAALTPADFVFAAGKHGVEIFFVISGFLITGSLLRHGDARRFLLDRAIRLYPVFLTIQCLVFAIGPAIHYKWFAGIDFGGWTVTFVENALFLPGLLDLPLAQLNAWSLSYEVGFYLVAASFFSLWKRWGLWLPVSLLGMLLSVVLLLYARAAFFVPGVMIFLMFEQSRLVLPRWFRALSIPSLVLMLALLTLAETTAGVVYLATVPAFVMFVCVVEGRCLLSALLRMRLPQYLGTISYSFYLWSPVVTFPMKLFIQRYLHGRLDDLAIVCLFAVLGFAGSIAVAHLSYRWLEDRAGRALHRRVYSGAGRMAGG